MTRTLGDLEGRWRLKRRITSASDPPGQFEGFATWTRVQRGRACHETGQLQIAGHLPMQAEHRYLWQPDLTVWFDDGRFFHQMPAEGGAASHWCDPDQHDGCYDCSIWPQFRVIWQVKGPVKDRKMVSDYTPAS